MVPPNREFSSTRPLTCEIPFVAPLAAYERLAPKSLSMVLHSALAGGDVGRYSFIAADPFRVLTSKNERVCIGGESKFGNPFDILSRELARYRLASVEGLPPFQTGIAGHFGYDLCHHLERLPRTDRDDLVVPDMAVGFYDAVVCFDHVDKRAWIVSSGFPESDEESRLARAKARIEYIQTTLSGTLPITPSSGSPCHETRTDTEWVSNFTRDAYENAVERILEYILAGDIYQANLAQCFSASVRANPWDVFKRMCQINPAPFAAFLKGEGFAVASASPERFMRLRGDRVETRPIKGTRPRGSSAAEDRANAQALRESEKDICENVMIVDLLRNDLSRVCLDHSVEVPTLFGIETYAAVHHLVSTVVGRLDSGNSAVDLMRATFPGGSITGAPKIRAMEIIAELEPSQRGPYCGCIGYIGFNGDMDTNIAIRGITFANNMASLHVGGGIVADSNPADEYEETLAKGRLLFDCLSA